jgi:hypothetical protein
MGGGATQSPQASAQAAAAAAAGKRVGRGVGPHPRHSMGNAQGNLTAAESSHLVATTDCMLGGGIYCVCIASYIIYISLFMYCCVFNVDLYCLLVVVVVVVYLMYWGWPGAVG